MCEVRAADSGSHRDPLVTLVHFDFSELMISQEPPEREASTVWVRLDVHI